MSDKKALHQLPGVEKPNRVIKPKRRQVLSLENYLEGIRKADRSIIGQTISLAESTNPKHRELSSKIIKEILPETGNSIRVGISGVPGVGKSTFIEALGMYLIENGKRVAVLAVDPSSERTGGSIMGDKTRMEMLSNHDNAYVRPSPSGRIQGGVARGTRESLLICEAAKYDVILIETVGVGQSETMVASLVDFFLLLMLGNAGDELQGIKRGIMEMADLIAINKADGNNLQSAQAAQAQYQSALNLLSKKDENWKPKVLTCSALKNKGIPEIWEQIEEFIKTRQQSGALQQFRKEQNLFWMHETIKGLLVEQFYKNPSIKERIEKLNQEVRAEKVSPFEAAEELINLNKQNDRN